MEDSVGQNAIKDTTFSNDQSTFDSKGSFLVNEPVGSATISPAGRDVALASRLGLHIIDLDNPYSPPRYLPHRTPWAVADVQWSPFSSRDYWIASTSNQKALIWNVAAPATNAVEHVLDAHTRALTDINFSAHEPDLVATCAVDSFVHCWDLRTPFRPVISFADWYAGATQVKWNRQDGHILASSHDEKFHIWDTRKDSHPLTTIEAHATKIYGIDWNRVEATNLLTCSLDRTIKIWNYEAAEEDRLIRTIHTPFPVWRARHTPFGYGVLVMPQRGSNELHLYDRRLEEGEPHDTPADPVYSFEGHQDQVKEFLWRVRHGEDNGKDNRSFQLVSWGADKQLRLHPMSEEVLDSIGYRQGQALHKQQRFSRKGAVYRTFHDRDRVTNVKVTALAPPLDGPRRGSAISEALHPSTNKTAIPSHLTTLSGSDKGMRIRSGEKKHVNPISWMAGVKFSTRDDASSPRDSSSLLTTSQVVSWDAPEPLGEEISAAGKRYTKVSFDEVDVPARKTVLSLNGPWGVDRASVHVKMTVKFPAGYPLEDVPNIVVEKTSSISDALYTKMGIELKKLCSEYEQEKQGSLEAVLRYALGDQDLDQSLSWLRKMHNIANDTFDAETAGESSSDEEDNIIGHLASIKARDLELSAADLVKNNANVPLPKHCAALFAPSGKLVCFFPSKQPTASLLDDDYATSRDRQHVDLFEGFGSLQHIRGKAAGDRDIKGNNGSTSSEHSYSSSSSSSFNSAEEPIGDFDPFSAFSLWAGGTIPKAPGSATRSMQRSQKLTAMSYNKQATTQVKMHVSIHSNVDIDAAYPKLALAVDYIFFGKAEVVCAHNAWTARNNGHDDSADVWDLARSILRDEVPLEVTADLLRKENILVVARRSIVHIKRRDSGLGFGFDEPASVREPRIKGHIKWGQHPLGSAYLVKAIFDHFESIGDVQMLAMLSCVLHEPAPIPSTNHSLAFWPPNQLPDVLNIPAFSPEYWPSSTVGRSFIEAPRSSIVSRPTSKANPEVVSSSYTSTFHSGSYASSITPIPTVFEHDEESASSQPRPIGLHREYSHGSSVKTRSFGTSPEHVLRRSSSIVGNAFNKVAHMLSNSPPLQRKEAASAADLSTSAPSSAIPISRARMRAEATSVRFSDPQTQARSNSTVTYDDNDRDTVADDDDESLGQKLRMKLLNQHLFDDEACFSGPLTFPESLRKHYLWRDEYASHLDAWDLREQHVELLSFNHIASRFLTSESTHPADEAWLPAPANKVVQLHDGPTIVLRCSNCQHTLPTSTISIVRNVSQTTQCGTCKKSRSRIFCGICYEVIDGIYKTCLGCGHIAHSRCFEQWIKMSHSTSVMCGECTCLCGEQTVVERSGWMMKKDKHQRA